MKKFSDLKEAYKNIDMGRSLDDTIVIGDFLIKECGDVYLSRIGFSVEGEQVGINTYLFRKRTVEQLESFIKIVLGE